MADFLNDHLVLESLKLYDDLPNEIAEVNVIHISSEEQMWQLFFDRESKTSLEGNIIVGVGDGTYFPI